MPKKFNDTGLCIPEKHYMADVSNKLQAIFGMVAEGSYFVINRPRQYGKTTILYLLERYLQTKQDYFPVFISFEGIGSDSYQREQQFIEAFFLQLKKVFRFYQRTDLLKLLEDSQNITHFAHLDAWLSECVPIAAKQVVLMIDEVDKSSNNQLFLDFLAMLRTKYLAAAQGKDLTFQSVILAGIHDVKSLKLKIRPDEERKYNSPWNIAVDFTVDLSLNVNEIQSMLADYVKETGVQMDQSQIADSLHYYTSGYPFLVSKLCKIIAEQLMRRNIWKPEFVDEAVNKLLQIQNTNFDSLIKNLENTPELYQLAEKMTLFGERVTYNQYSHTIHLGIMYGIFALQDNAVEIHNRIYREQIYNYMAANQEIQALVETNLSDYNAPQQFLLPDGALDLEKVLLKFQEFMKHEYSQRDKEFLERNGRLIFLAFLKPIINGKGYDFKEPQISEEKRLDVAVVFGTWKYVVELKLWRGEAAHQEGLRQLHDYLERTGLAKGYLIIFDLTKKGQKAWKQEQLQLESKTIFVVWV